MTAVHNKSPMKTKTFIKRENIEFIMMKNKNNYLNISKSFYLPKKNTQQNRGESFDILSPFYFHIPFLLGPFDQ